LREIDNARDRGAKACEFARDKVGAMPARTDAKAFDAILAGRSPEIAAVARAARLLVLDVLPEAYEVVWAQQKNAGYGTGPKKQTEHFCKLESRGDVDRAALRALVRAATKHRVPTAKPL
jgi:hypothetical protein